MVTARSCFLPSCCNLLQVNTNFILRGHTVVYDYAFLHISLYTSIEKLVDIKVYIVPRTQAYIRYSSLSPSPLSAHATNIQINTHTHIADRQTDDTHVYIFLRFAVFYVSWIDANFLTGMMRCSLSCMSRQSRICMATMLSTRIIHLGSLYCAFVDYREKKSIPALRVE